MKTVRACCVGVVDEFTRESSSQPPAAERLSAPTIRGASNATSKRKQPPTFRPGADDWSLAVTYSHMAYSHTTIGAERFHFRVRNGIGWFPLAMAAREFFTAMGFAAPTLNNLDVFLV